MQADLFATESPPNANPGANANANANAVAPLQAQVDALPAGWRELLQPCLGNAAWTALCDFVDGERAGGKPVFPHAVFHALHLTPPDSVRVVILGQDPYHGTGVVGGAEIPQAHGLAFSVPDGVKVPPSLRNIFKEIGAEYGAEPVRASGNLEGWARQGVLLLNTVLTVEQGNAASHARRGWEAVTDCLIHALAMSRPNLVFMLWGSHAQAKKALLEGKPHCVLEAPHPSPLSAHRGFLGCGHFRQANDWLERHGKPAIDWLAS
ncbi:uracil-DNA glycosylase [Cupriavidus pauculus]|uniref:uracil-DNA glycosylase n=1 Tax=Cupriavidus pauculus TaxID=82633 RepID=UPI0012465DCD|nr:uracil-DNA glycosylase [Cupriavidus pauculus]KAB0597369.1 uracil-DNA glycosylase [Cupriavidus pauculus]MCM3608980.1 uracil-DNA glycosylase [Cupriavidus pauculus]UAL00883.1 uracil-DNA glycosylase [Cupriavidus pauculus]